MTASPSNFASISPSNPKIRISAVQIVFAYMFTQRLVRTLADEHVPRHEMDTFQEHAKGESEPVKMGVRIEHIYDFDFTLSGKATPQRFTMSHKKTGASVTAPLDVTRKNLCFTVQEVQEFAEKTSLIPPHLAECVISTLEAWIDYWPLRIQIFKDSSIYKGQFQATPAIHAGLSAILKGYADYRGEGLEPELVVIDYARIADWLLGPMQPTRNVNEALALIGRFVQSNSGKS